MKSEEYQSTPLPQLSQPKNASGGSAPEISYSEWLDAVRRAAKTRGGQAWTASKLSRATKAYRQLRDTGQPYLHDRKAGEIVNPITGEIVTACVTIGALAKTLGITTAKLTDEMVRRCLVHRVLSYREVPMVCEPSFRKPDYYLTPEPLASAVKAGLVIPLKGHWNAQRRGPIRTMILVTPKGQSLLGESAAAKVKPQKRVDVQRDTIRRLYQDGRSPVDIVDLTGIPRRTVFRRLADIRLAS